ncbi:MAG: FAD-dependent oxidoreductase [Erysipelotrichaceae bacterium]|nr:FAD-dependent oxidoreductase [Erysipelotrichaceae bacterium]
MYKKLFTPMKVGTCEIPNRLVVPAMVTNYCTKDGFLTDRYIKYIEEKAKGGWGMIITEDYNVTEHGKGYERIPGFWLDDHVELNKKLTDIVHQYDSKIFCQMYHPGRQSSAMVNGGMQPIAPAATKDPICMDLAREMSVDEIHTLVQDFKEAARRCKESGFDGIELHCAHGYLLAEFLSPYVNKRVDQYGGCFDNRVRIVDEIIVAMREAVGDFPIQIRISGNEYVVGGRTEAETYQLVRHLEEVGFDAIHVSNGVYAAHPLNQIIAPMFTDHALNMDTAEQVKKLVNIPVILSNRINEPMMADTLLVMGKADFIGMARGSLADPYLPCKAKRGQMDQINYCIGCLQGCEWALFMNDSVTCLVNPRVGREYECEIKEAENKKNVMVIGGGPAGLIAARTAAMRGHKVSIYEAQEQLGGQFRSAAYPIGKGELSTVTSSYRANNEALGVDIHLNTEVNEELIKEVNPDAIVIATGAKPAIPPIKGIENTVTAEDMLLGKHDISNGSIVVCGGGEVGGETAHYLAEKNPNVTILEMQSDILNDMMPMTKTCLVEMIQKSGIKVYTNAKVLEITENSVIYEDQNRQQVTIPADQVVSAFGYKAYNPLEETAKKLCDEVYVVGGAIQAGGAIAATKEGYEAGLKI